MLMRSRGEIVELKQKLKKVTKTQMGNSGLITAMRSGKTGSIGAHLSGVNLFISDYYQLDNKYGGKLKIPPVRLDVPDKRV